MTAVTIHGVVLNSMTGVLRRERQRKIWHRDTEEKSTWAESQRSDWLSHKWSEANSHKKWEEARKHSALKPLEGVQPSQHLDFCLVKPWAEDPANLCPDSWFAETEITNRRRGPITLSCYVCDNVVMWPQMTNINLKVCKTMVSDWKNFTIKWEDKKLPIWLWAGT